MTTKQILKQVAVNKFINNPKIIYYQFMLKLLSELHIYTIKTNEPLHVQLTVLYLQ